MLIQCIYLLVNYQEAITGTSCWTGRVGEREEEKYQFVFKLSYDVQCVFLYYFTRLALDTRSTCHLHHLSQL